MTEIVKSVLPTNETDHKYINLVKVCVGISSVANLIERQQSRIDSGQYKTPEHITRMHPRRTNELLNGGSIYWIINGFIKARQSILALESRKGLDGIYRCAIVMNQKIVRTQQMRRRPFQGWRYLPPENSPADINDTLINGDTLPIEIAIEIDKIGVI